MTSKNLRMRVAAMTHSGKLRPDNEDCIGIADWLRTSPMSSAIAIECLTDEQRVCVVADGMGGHAGGKIASMMIVRDVLDSAPRVDSDESIVAALAHANQRVFDAMDASPALRGMGATVVGVVARASALQLFNIGDSRGYVRSDNHLRLLTIDDTSAFSSANSRERTGQSGHGITGSIGGVPSFTPISPHLVSRGIAPGDRYVLCSDGLTDMLDQDAIESCLEVDAAASVQRLVSAALSAGGEDNISVMIIDFLEGFAPISI